jgi:hypothetical protein
VEVKVMTQLALDRPSWVTELDQGLDALFGELFGPPAARRWHPAIPQGQRGDG